MEAGVPERGSNSSSTSRTTALIAAVVTGPALTGPAVVAGQPIAEEVVAARALMPNCYSLAQAHALTQEVFYIGF